MDFSKVEVEEDTGVSATRGRYLSVNTPRADNDEGLYESLDRDLEEYLHKTFGLKDGDVVRVDGCDRGSNCFVASGGSFEPTGDPTGSGHLAVRPPSTIPDPLDFYVDVSIAVRHVYLELDGTSKFAIETFGKDVPRECTFLVCLDCGELDQYYVTVEYGTQGDELNLTTLSKEDRPRYIEGLKKRHENQNDIIRYDLTVGRLCEIRSFKIEPLGAWRDEGGGGWSEKWMHRYSGPKCDERSFLESFDNWLKNSAPHDALDKMSGSAKDRLLRHRRTRAVVMALLVRYHHADSILGRLAPDLFRRVCRFLSVVSV